jgi:hypothetical protein
VAYHPLFGGLWHHAALEGAPFEEKAFFAFLWSNDRMRPSGIYRVTDAQLAADAELPVKTVTRYITDLVQRRRIVRDGAWIFVRGYFARQPKQDRLLLGVQSDVYACSSMAVLTSFGEKYPMYSKWSTDRLEKVNNPQHGFVLSEQLQIQSRAGTEQKDGPGTVWPSPAALVALYNTQAPEECAEARDLSPKRLVKLQVALRAFPDQAWWEHVFAQMRASRFLRGLKNRPGPHEKWVADLDWLLSGNKDGTENYVLVHDGRYLDG